MCKKLLPFVVIFLFILRFSQAQQSRKWGDQHDGTYANPILPGDFQNTDVIHVDSDYYYISATKELSPGMMILTSKDLVNWRIIGHAVSDITQISPRYSYKRMERPSRGIWAGAIAYHNHKFYIYFTDPDFGIYMTSAENPAGPWTPLVPLLKAAGWDDPCPLWDNGKAWLIATNFADNYKIHLFGMTSDGEQLIVNDDTVIHQSEGSEANKIYKINNYYYHFYSEVTPEGRMPFMERSINIKGPYTEKKQLIHSAEGEPNQGGLIQTPDKKWFFITHHGNGNWDGREASALPVQWINGWPVWGKAGDDGIGNMMWSAVKPIERLSRDSIQTNDNFDERVLAPQWEWYFQPDAKKWSLTARPGYLRLYAAKTLQAGDIISTPNVLTQRPLRINKSRITVKINIKQMTTGQIAALAIFGKTSAEIGVIKTAAGKCFYYNHNGAKTSDILSKVKSADVWLRSEWDINGSARFFYSTNGKSFISITESFQITSFGNYLGAKIGIYTTNAIAENGFVDVDWFRYDKL